MSAPIPVRPLSFPPPPVDQTLLRIPPELLPDIESIVIDDGAPVDGRITERNMRLLTEPLYASWTGPGDGRPFEAMANVGVFHTVNEPPIVPDVLLVVDLVWPADLSKKENLSYFVWLRGKVPDVAIEIVSNNEGGEDDRKMAIYARIGVRHYVIFDPDHYLSEETLRVFQLCGPTYKPIAPSWLDAVGLGLKLWEGEYQGSHQTWLRWCDRNGELIPTGAEGQEQQRQRAEAERQRAEAERQRAEAERQRAKEEQQRAEAEHQRANQATLELERLRAELRARGIELP